MKCTTCRTRHAEPHSKTCHHCQRKVDKVILRLNKPVDRKVADSLRDKGIVIIGGQQ